MKKQLLTKTLLMAVMLLGGANFAWGETLNPTVKMTYISGSDANVDTSFGEVTTAYCGYNSVSAGTVNIANKSWGVNNIAYLQVDASALPDGATVTAASLTLDCQKISARNLSYGVGYHSAAWSSAMTWNTADRSITTMGATQGVSKENGEESKTFDIVAAFRGDADNVVTILVYQTAAGAGYVKNPSVTITYTTETAYSVTFAETNSVAATVKIGGSDVTSGTLLTNGTYDFTATATGYQDYEGSFTVSGADREVSFTMTAKTVYNYSVNAVDGGSKVLASSIVSGSCYKDETASFYIPACVLKDGTLYFTANEAYSKSETISSANQVISYGYTTSSVSNVVYFGEGENLSGATSGNPSAARYLASRGYLGRGSNMSITTLPAGSYTIYIKYINTNASGHSIVVMAGDTEVMNEADVTVRPTKSASFTLTESKALTVTAAGSSTSGIDYIYIVKTGEVATIGSYGYTTFSSSYPLALGNMTASTGTATAYYATTINPSSVSLTSIDSNVEEGEGLILKGTAGATITIPVAASGSAITNYLVGCPTATTITSETSGYENFYVLVNNTTEGRAEFQNLASYLGGHNVTIPAGKAYLNAAATNARALSIVFGDDEVTGISLTENSELRTENAVYDLQGRRVAQPQKGLYIVNGKKVVIK